jgi:hypothetical protein
MYHVLAALLSYRHLRVPLQLRQLMRPLRRRPPRMDMLLMRGKMSLKMKTSSKRMRSNNLYLVV